MHAVSRNKDTYSTPWFEWPLSKTTTILHDHFSIYGSVLHALSCVRNDNLADINSHFSMIHMCVYIYIYIYMDTHTHQCQIKQILSHTYNSTVTHSADVGRSRHQLFGVFRHDPHLGWGRMFMLQIWKSLELLEDIYSTLVLLVLQYVWIIRFL